SGSTCSIKINRESNMGTDNVESHIENGSSKKNEKRIDKNVKAKPKGCGQWFNKYFCEGQALEHVEELPVDASMGRRFLVKYRRAIGFLIPTVFCLVIWLAIAIKKNLWPLFVDNYFMSITMIFGSLIAGMTSEGAAAIAFPVMTLAFKISPNVARDFALTSQSCGMSAATFTILWMRVKLEWTAIIVCSVGGMFGVIIGLEVIDGVLTPPQKKFIFVSIWFSFGFALFLLNRYRHRRTFEVIPYMNPWKILVLLLTGFIGGIFTSIAASGVDICTFSILTLVFRVSEKTATPTSVILMAGNALFAFFWRDVMQEGIHQDAWSYLAVTAEIVVVGAPLGSVIGTHFHRLVLAGFVYIIGTAALIGAFAIVRPLAPALVGLSVGIIVGAFIVFVCLTRAGQMLLSSVEEQENNDLKKNEDPLENMDNKNEHNEVDTTIEPTGGNTNNSFQDLYIYSKTCEQGMLFGLEESFLVQRFSL
ncbi:unnamed protein product, partial [Owenia fusiformis]